jgi:NTP pyrophosphatase (non-canonical NTP hydrolase)
MIPPPANTSPEAVRLRAAAMAWTRYSDEADDGDDYDRRGQRLNTELLAAARAYAGVVEEPVGPGPAAEFWRLREARGYYYADRVDDQGQVLEPGTLMSTDESVTRRLARNTGRYEWPADAAARLAEQAAPSWRYLQAIVLANRQRRRWPSATDLGRTTEGLAEELGEWGKAKKHGDRPGMLDALGDLVAWCLGAAELLGEDLGPVVQTIVQGLPFRDHHGHY